MQYAPASCTMRPSPGDGVGSGRSLPRKSAALAHGAHDVEGDDRAVGVGRGQFDVLVRVVEGGADEGRHGAVDDRKRLGPIRLDPRHLAHQPARGRHHGPAGLDDEGEAEAGDGGAHGVDEVGGGGEDVAAVVVVDAEAAPDVEVSDGGEVAVVWAGSRGGQDAWRRATAPPPCPRPPPLPPPILT